jgi:hypothetical protein
MQIACAAQGALKGVERARAVNAANLGIRPDQPGAFLPGERKLDEEISLFEADMRLVIDRRAGRLYISDIKRMMVGAPTRAHRLVHDRARAVTRWRRLTARPGYL